MNRLPYLLICLSALWSAMWMNAQPIITVGEHVLQPNQPGQTITINVSGVTPVQGLTLNLQVADGGFLAGGSINGPKITAVDIVTGTIFAGNNTAPQDPGSVPQVAIRSITTASGTINANGLLVTVTIDTTSFDSGTWSLSLRNTRNGPTDFAGVTANITDGSILISGGVPVYTIGVSASPPSGGMALKGGDYAREANVTVVATANPGYTFVNWTENDSEVITSANYQFVASANRTLVANFIPTPSPPRILSLNGDLAFGSVMVRTSAQSTLTVANTGSSMLTVSGITYPSGFSGNWSAGTIPGGGSQNVIVTFSPASEIGYSGDLTVHSDKTSGINTIAASGTGTLLEPTRNIVLSGTLAFANLSVDSSAQVTLRIANTGNSTLTVSSINYPSGFSGNWLGGTIGAGSSRLLTVTFAPTAEISYAGTVTVNANQTSGVNTIEASGTGTPGPTRIIVLSGTLAFDNFLVGSSAQRTLTISNTGNSRLTVSSINYPAGFSGNWPNGPIGAGSSQLVTVTFAPMTESSYAGTVTVNTDRTFGVNTINASSAGATRILSLNGDTAFGGVTVRTSAQLTLTIANTGNSTLTVSGISYPIGFSGDWSAGTIPGGGSQNVTVTFSPASELGYSGDLTIHSDKTSGIETWVLSGAGEPLPTRILALNGDLSFGGVRVGTLAQRTLTIANTGNSTLTVSGISYPSEFRGDWPGGTIAAGGSQNVIVTFSPASEIGYGGDLAVNSDKTSGTETRALSGTGTPPLTRIILLNGDLAFGGVTVGTLARRTLTIANIGNTPLTVISISYPTGLSGDWPSGTIAVGGSQNVTVTFAPASEVGYGGDLAVNSDKTSGTETRALSGTGTPPLTRIILLNGDLAFGGVTVGTFARRTLTIANIGNTPLTVISISYPSGFSGNWSAGTIPAGGSQNVVVELSALSASNYDSRLKVNSDATGGSGSMAVSGTGELAAQFNIGAMGVIQSGGFHVSISGKRGALFIIEVSTDMRNWQELARLPNPTGTVEYSDTTTSDARQQFYRFRSP